jgi:hypothetical protein
MEPANERQDDLDGKPVETTPPNMPQWSPPTIGWTIVPARNEPVCGEKAAMEPAGDRRGDDRELPRADPGGAAAMEPAEDRRGDFPGTPGSATTCPGRNGARRRPAG